MSEAERTTPAPKCATPRVDEADLVDPTGHLEDADYALARKLGLRPSAWSFDTDAHLEGHPDQRPCPSWCWVANQEDYGHSSDTRRPFEAEHGMEATIHIAVGEYWGRKELGRMVPATVEPRLEQIGQRDPVIRIALRRAGRDGKQRYDRDRLKLRIDEAQDLIVALQYLVNVADGGDL